MDRETDLERVRRMLAGDEAAFEAFFDATYPALYRFALVRLGFDREAAGSSRETTYGAKSDIAAGQAHRDTGRYCARESVFSQTDAAVLARGWMSCLSPLRMLAKRREFLRFLLLAKPPLNGVAANSRSREPCRPRGGLTCAVAARVGGGARALKVPKVNGGEYS